MEKLYDAIIVGGGPAGLSAAIYMARAQFKVLVIEKEKMGGQITITSEVVNYPGILKTDGEQLTTTMVRQAEQFGASFLSAQVTSLELKGDYKIVHTDRGDFKTLGVIYAAGARPRYAGFEGEDRFRGHGVAYCATCDGEFFTGKDIFVVGGGYAAVEEALFLTRYAQNIVMILRGDDFSIQSAVVEELKAHPKVQIMYHTEIEEVRGKEEDQNHIRHVIFRNRETGKASNYFAPDGDYCGVFVFVGYAPQTELVKGQIDLNDHGYILTDRNQKTNIEGVYAAGDICVKNLRQVVTAVADGAIAATSLEKHLGDQYRKLGLKREIVSRHAPESKEEKPQTDGSFLDANMKQALAPIFERFENSIILRLYTDDTDMTEQNKVIITELSELTDKIKGEYVEAPTEDLRHTIAICDEKGQEKGMRFHGIPGGHEFNAFVLAMYNAAGPGQSVGDDTQKRIESISEKKHIRIVVSLSCTMCPDLVTAAERIAADNDNVEVDIYEMQHYPELREKYNIMSVPCFIINDEDPHFGKKNVNELLDLLHA